MDGSKESSPALPSAWIERLFARFQAAYGNRTATMWKDANPDEVRALWAEELGRFDPSDIRSALEALRYAHLDYPPTLYEFGSLCRNAMAGRTQAVAKVTYVRYGQVAPEVLAIVHELVKSQRKRDPRDWARKILKREMDGEKVNLYALQSAKEALGIGERE